MKKYLVVVLIVLVGGALLIVPLLKDDGTDPIETDSRPTAAVFDFKGDPGTFAGKESTLKIKLVEKGLKKIEVVYLDKVLQTWNNPSGNLKVVFTPVKVGTSTIRTHTTNWLNQERMNKSVERNRRGCGK